MNSKQNKQKSAKNPALKSVSLSPAQLNSRQEQLLVIDVRGWFEYFIGHIAGAERMSRDRILKEIPKDRAIAITCLSGHRSNMSAQWLVSEGYSKVHNLQGGLLAWQGAGYPVHRGNQP
jgi:rhodanese-related sulfurtransferase